MIKLGVCASAENAGFIAAAGFDYIECALSGLAAMNEIEYSAALENVLNSPIRAEAFNLMIPPTIPVAGPHFNNTNIRNYFDHVLPRASSMGCRVIVFGSGGARKVPDGYDKKDAYDDIIAYLRIAGDRCEKYGITIAIEPLNSAECNILNSVAEAVWVANRANHPAVKVLADNYHIEKDNQSFHEIRAAGKLMAHIHVSHSNRNFPYQNDGYDYGKFFGALSDIGYDCRVSVEGVSADFKNDLSKAYQVLDSFRKRY